MSGNVNMNSWSDQKIKRLQDWIRISHIYSTCHNKAYEYYSMQFNRITIAVITLGALAALLEGTNLLLPTANIGLGITVVLLTSSVSGLNLWLNSKNPAEMAFSHENMSKGYNRIVLKIESSLACDEPERDDGVKFLSEIRDNLTDLSTGGKSIPAWIWDDVNKDINNTHKELVRKSTARSKIPNEPDDSPPTQPKTPGSSNGSEPKFEILFDPEALKVADLMTKYQTARYRSAY